MREITPHDELIASNLRRLFEKSKTTQVSAAKTLKMTQSAVSQYINGRIALNTDVIVSFAKLLNVKPTEIDPNFGEEFLKSWSKHNIKIVGTNRRVLVNASSDQCIALRVASNDVSDRLRIGDLVIINPMATIDATKEPLVSAYYPDNVENAGAILYIGPDIEKAKDYLNSEAKLAIVESIVPGKEGWK